MNKWIEQMKAQQGTAPEAPTLSRRQFTAFSLGGMAGLALWPADAAQAQSGQGSAGSGSAAAPAPALKPTQQPRAFISIAPDGTTTVLCNRLDMGQGIETALALICAEELDADWSKVRTGFGDAGAAYVDPAMGMHLTGGSNSVKNSYGQYRELGARLRAMLLAAAARQWNVPVASLSAAQGVVTGPAATPGGAVRRAGYGDLFEAALREPVPASVVLKNPQDFKLIGQPTTLKVARAKSTGTQAYAMDVKLPGLLTAVIVRPPVFGGKVARHDATQALKVRGVKAVLPVPLDRGGQGLAVVAEGFWPAQKGREALVVDWDLAGLDRADSGRMLAQYRELAAQPGRLAPQKTLQADVSALAGAPRKLVAEFVFPYLNHAQMEPLACTVDLRDDGCTLYMASQMPGGDAMAVAQLLSLRPDQVRIQVQMAGGGFGRRATPTGEWPREAAAVAQAMRRAGLRAPVKVVWSREDDMRAGYYRPYTVHRAEIGLDAQGRVLAWDHRIVSQSIAQGTPFEGMMAPHGVDPMATEGMRDPYALPMRLSVHHPKANVPVLWWRSVGATHTAFVMETLADELAQAAGQDPVAWRLAQMAGHPRAERHRAALNLAVERSGYGRTALPPGVAWGVALHESFDSVVAYVVQATLEGQGAQRRPKLLKVTAGVHCNLCVNPRTVEAQVQGSVMMALATTLPGHAITLRDGVVEQGNFHQYTQARMGDAPAVDVHIVPSAAPPTGMGEPALPPLAPAFANAVARLTGQRLRELPFRMA